MLSERFFDILSDASGGVAGSSRQVLARCNSLSGKTFLATLARTSAQGSHLRQRCSHLVLVRPVLCEHDEAAHSALN